MFFDEKENTFSFLVHISKKKKKKRRRMEVWESIINH